MGPRGLHFRFNHVSGHPRLPLAHLQVRPLPPPQLCVWGPSGSGFCAAKGSSWGAPGPGSQTSCHDGEGGDTHIQNKHFCWAEVHSILPERARPEALDPSGNSHTVECGMLLQGFLRLWFSNSILHFNPLGTWFKKAGSD